MSITSDQIQSIKDILDKTISEISHREIVATSEMINLLLDIRLMLLFDEEATPNLSAL